MIIQSLPETVRVFEMTNLKEIFFEAEMQMDDKNFSEAVMVSFIIWKVDK